ncbi:MAG: UDP-N-acetylmuramoyl-L-alanine--D-glutamate ligase [Pseudomonadota bacterium]
MIVCSTFAGRTVAVFGLGRSGLTAVASLKAGGANVIAWDDGESARARAGELDVAVADLANIDWSDIAALVLAPGVPLTHPAPHWTVEKARAAEVDIIGDTELFFRARDEAARDLGIVPRVIAITGTNGKSTTSALTAHLLADAGCDVALGGNIGDAVLGLEAFDGSRIYVIEFSSYQIDLTPSLHPQGAALLNVTPDHLDRHGSLEHYAAVKARVFKQLETGDTAVVGIDDPLSAAIAKHIPPAATRIKITTSAQIDDGLAVRNGKLFVHRAGTPIEAADFSANLALRGAHNGQNVAAAWMLATAMDVTPEALQRGLASFAGLAHRLEYVGHLPKPDGRVLFVNDSKGTNAEAAGHALAAFDDIFWIAGGRAKDGGISGLAERFDRLRAAFLIGEAADDFAATLRALGGDTDAITLSGELDRAVEQATTAAVASPIAEPVVLLSPAAASFDQFADFEKRGDAFRKKLRALPGFVPASEEHH